MNKRESLGEVLGGRRGALDASVPPLAFVIGWLATGQDIGIGAAAALGASVLVGAYRLIKGGRITNLVVSVALVAAAALIALHTGRAEDFFLLRLMSNVASALLWAASIAIRWPLLGVVVGVVIGQKTAWRKDPDLLKAYSRASWVWVLLQYTLRVIVWGLLWWAGEVVALSVVTFVMSWPLVAATVAVSGLVVFRSLPQDHPGLRHPRTSSDGRGADGPSTSTAASQTAPVAPSVEK
ncbi:DUF3159 domain-containing protein [Kibdelosporangium phytohabitans]|uniref:DUF3159 domain-containing protein n=1 Tax=Kibdelosporangium phytohabitans TaxID=860235 RepID=UPI0009FA7EDF|nr:DUF3159 domain-containing protein [Kibdelosporangium phytohabitans]MBE1465999.1 hypothetical protein [Kibdelosporangium phytohabitans]